MKKGLKNYYVKSNSNLLVENGYVLYEGRVNHVVTSCFTLSSSIYLSKEQSGYLRGKSLLLVIEAFGASGEEYISVQSSSAPNVVGKWEISTTLRLRYGIKYIRCKLIYNINDVKSVAVSDIRLTASEGKTEAFFCPVVRPFRDVTDGKSQFRDYSESSVMSDKELVDYLIYARDKEYNYDLSQVMQNLYKRGYKYSFFYKLFIYDDTDILKQKNALSFLQGLDDSVVDKIYEKLALLGQYELLNSLCKGNASNSPYSELLKVHMGLWNVSLKNISLISRKEEANISIFNKKEKLIHFCYANCEDLPVNRWIISWFDENFSEIQRRAKLLTRSEKLNINSLPVFVYWDKGIENAPPVVKKCFDRMKHLFGERLHVLDMNNIKHYARLENTGQISTPMALADYLRAELLMRYGGIWIDSTVYVKDEFLTLTNEYSDIVPTYMPAYKHMGNWLLSVGERYSYFYCLMYSALNMFLYEHKDFKTYYMFHRFWEVICFADKEAASYWNNAYKISARNALEMWLGKPGSLIEDRSDPEFEAFYNISPVHKLTYKYNEDEAGFYSNISRMLRLGTEGNIHKTSGEICLNGRNYYFDDLTGKPVTGLRAIKSEEGEDMIGYFDGNGWMKKGKYMIAGNELNFDEKGKMVLE